MSLKTFEIVFNKGKMEKKLSFEAQQNPTYAALCMAVDQTGISQRDMIAIAEKFLMETHKCPRSEKRSRSKMLLWLKTNESKLIPIIKQNQTAIYDFQKQLILNSETKDQK